MSGIQGIWPTPYRQKLADFTTVGEQEASCGAWLQGLGAFGLDEREAGGGHWECIPGQDRSDESAGGSATVFVDGCFDGSALKDLANTAWSYAALEIQVRVDL